EGAAQLSAAKEELAEANAEVGVLLDQLFSDSTATLSGPQVATLAIARESVARNVLPQYRVLDLSEPEWIAVEAALRAERRAQRTGEPMPEAASSLLQVLNTNPLVTAAAAALELNMPEIDALV